MARIVDPISGRTMAIESNQPGVQPYTGNCMDGSRKDVILRPGQTYKHVTLITFGAN